jgi:hypothetical protein
MRYLFAVLLGLALVPANAADTPEETVVRKAYANLSLAVDINTVYRVVKSNPNVDSAELSKQVALRGLRFQFSDFMVGNLADVGDAKFTDIWGQYPDGQDIVKTTLATENRSEGDGPTVSSTTATAEWGKGPSGTPPSFTAREMLHVAEDESGVKPLLRYCTYTVKVTLAGKSRTYRAAFLFGENGKVAPGDVVVGLGGGPLLYFTKHPLSLDVLLKTSLGQSPAVRSFLQTTGGGQ